MAKEHYITWDKDSESSKRIAVEKHSENIESYEAVASYGRRSRDFIDIEPNRSVRPGYTFTDYYAFRPDEEVPDDQKKIIKMCMDAYDKVGIVKNIIDLMGDFGSKGINIVHENKSVEDFYQEWFKRVNGPERSERILNNLYRTGNVIIYKSYATITPDIVRYIKSIGKDITVEIPEIEKNVVPWTYTFFNPLTVNAKDGKVSLSLTRKKYNLNIKTFTDNFKDGSIPLHYLDMLPPNIKSQIQSGAKQIDLDPESISVFFYKKDDWQTWANPMVYSILDDIIMLQKMRLADLSALDGAISNIRLWTLGNFEHQIFPTKAAINKLRNILASNVGGGTMELVWGPELSYTESNSQVYKFLGSEKYQSVLNSIYAGLGVPPTLTGMAGNGGGFTNNFVSLKTLVERLQYGRDKLVKFWENEAEIVRKAMGFRKSPHVVFDQMSLSDEASEKALLIQLADREIISHETILERFNEVPSVEKMRLKRESKDREDESLPNKISPYRKPADEFEAELKLKKDQQKQQEQQKKFQNPNGRPLNQKDNGPRKQRVDTPKSKPGVATIVTMAQVAFDKICALLNEAVLSDTKKTNLRQLTKLEIEQLEYFKLVAFSNIDISEEITDENILKALKKSSILQEFQDLMQDYNISYANMTVDDYKKALIGVYVEHYNL
jgi:hypothetical protein